MDAPIEGPAHRIPCNGHDWENRGPCVWSGILESRQTTESLDDICFASQ